MKLREWILLSIFFTICILDDTIYGLLLILYPQIAESKGTTALEFTIVFGIYPGTIAIVCPLVENIISASKIHPKWMFIGSMLIGSIVLGSFGLVVYIENRTLFISISICLQILKGILTGIHYVACYSMIPSLFPDQKFGKFIMGGLESADPIGSIVGSLAGSLLFSIGGFPLPFITIGCSIAILAGIMILLVSGSNTNNFHYDSHEEDKETEKFPIVGNENGSLRTVASNHLKILSQPKILLSFITIVLAEIVMTFSNSTIEPYLRKEFGSSPFQSGMVISISALSALIFPIFGYYNFQKPILDTIVFIGITLELVGVLLIGPLPIAGSYYMTLGSMVMITLGGNLIIFPAFLRILLESEFLGYKNNNNVTTRLSGIYQAVLMGGGMIGPPISGALYDQYGYRNAETFCVIILGILILYYSWVLAKDVLICISEILNKKPTEL